MIDVVADLLGVGGGIHFGIGGFDFDDAARGMGDAEERSFFIGVLELVGGEKAAVRQTRAAVFDM